MKKGISKFLVSAIILTSVAAPIKNVYAANSAVKASASVPSSITVNKIKFATVAYNQLSPLGKSMVDNMKIKRGYYVWSNRDGSYTILISSGQKNTGGYDIKTDLVEDNEGKTNIMVTETSPAPDVMVNQLITYPYTIIKIKGVTPNIHIVNQNGTLFSPIKYNAGKL